MKKKEERQEQRQQVKAKARSTVASVLAEDEVIQKDKLVELVTDYETEMTDVIASERAAIEKNTELSAQLEALETEKAALTSEVVALKEELAAVKTQLEEVSKKNSELESKLVEVEREATLQQRVGELESAGILISEGPAAEKQKAKVKGMSDSEFADYKEEFLAARDAWKKESAEVKSEEKASVEEEASKTAEKILAAKEAMNKAKVEVAALSIPTSAKSEKLDFSKMWKEE